MKGCGCKNKPKPKPTQKPENNTTEENKTQTK